MKSYIIAVLYKEQEELGVELYSIKCLNESKGLLHIRRKFYLDFGNREFVSMYYIETNLVLSQTIIIPEET